MAGWLIMPERSGTKKTPSKTKLKRPPTDPNRAARRVLDAVIARTEGNPAAPAKNPAAVAPGAHGRAQGRQGPSRSHDAEGEVGVGEEGGQSSLGDLRRWRSSGRSFSAVACAAGWFGFQSPRALRPHTAGPDPESAIVAAVASGLDAEWCEHCAGTGTSRRWSGRDQSIPCEPCHGTGAAAR